MNRLTPLLNIVSTVMDLFWFVWQWVMVPSYLIVALYALSATFGDTAFEQNTDWEWMFMLAFLFLIPFLIADYATEKGDNPRSIRFLNIFRSMITVFTIVAGIMWYLYPQNDRLEPLMFVYGAIATWMTYLHGRFQSRMPNENTNL